MHDNNLFTSRLCAGLVVAVIALVLSACSDPEADDYGTGSVETEPSKDRQYGFIDRELAPHQKPATLAPKARIPSRPPPRGLTMQDLRYGKGPMAGPGDEAIVNYVAYHYATQRRFDTSYGLNPVPYRVYPGQGDFITGFEDGIVGMRAGGRRQITIPPDKGYGSRGYNDLVKPGETIVFIVDLEALDKRQHSPK